MTKRKKRFPSIYDAARDGLDESFTPTVPPAKDPRYQPTSHPPGSIEKIEILRQRLDDGVPLWHPGDTRVRTQPDRIAYKRGEYVPNESVPGIREVSLRDLIEG